MAQSNNNYHFLSTTEIFVRVYEYFTCCSNFVCIISSYNSKVLDVCMWSWYTLNLFSCNFVKIAQYIPFMFTDKNPAIVLLENKENTIPDYIIHCVQYLAKLPCWQVCSRASWCWKQHFFHGNYHTIFWNRDTHYKFIVELWSTQA